MQETTESARRWIGFVCPDCRFVFRVPRDHDGVGLVCPSCRRMLKIPAPGDPVPPLVAPIRGQTIPRDSEADAEVNERKKHRRRRSRKSGDHSWDRSSSSTRESLREEKRHMFWMLVGGGTLFAMIVSAVLVAMLGNDPVEAPPLASVADPSPPPVVEPAANHPAVAPSEFDQASFLQAAEPLALKFLQARKVDDLIPLVRDPATAAPRIRAFYPDGRVEAPGLAGFNTDSDVTHIGGMTQVFVRTGDFDERVMYFSGKSPDLRIDWESWVGWSELPWQQFQEEKPTTPKLFRVILSEVDYYNFAFADEEKFHSFRLESPDGAHSIFGYTERGSVIASRLRPSPDRKKIPLTLSLAFPEQSSANNQVWIRDLLAEGWVLDSAAP